MSRAENLLENLLECMIPRCGGGQAPQAGAELPHKFAADVTVLTGISCGHQRPYGGHNLGFTMDGSMETYP